MALLYSLKLTLSRPRKKYKRKLANRCIKPVCFRGGTLVEAKVFELVKHDKRGVEAIKQMGEESYYRSDESQRCAGRVAS